MSDIIRTNIQEIPSRWLDIRGRDQHWSADMDILTRKKKWAGKKYVCQNPSCGKEFYSIKGYASRTPKYCSRECAKPVRFEKGFTPWSKGKRVWDTRPHPKGTLGKKFIGRTVSEEGRRKMSIARTGEKRPWLKGANSPLWRGGLTKLSKLIRESADYKSWRKAVFERDNYVCQSCGIRGGKLHADHIKPFAKYPELRLELSNGRTLCEACHRKTDTYGRGSR